MKILHSHQVIPCLILFMVFMIPCFRVHAGEWTISPDLSFTETYDDNIMFKDVSGFEHRLTPFLRGEYLSPRTELKVSGKLDIFRISGHSRFNRENQDYRLGLEHFLSSRVVMKMGAGLRIDHTFETELEEAGIITDRSRRAQYHVSPGLGVILSPRDRLDMDVSWSMRNNSRRERADFQSGTGNIIWSRRLLDDRTTILAGTGLEYVDFDLHDGSGSHAIYTIMAGLSRDISSRTSFALQGGPSWTKSRYDRARGRGSDSRAGFTLNGRASWQAGERTEIAASYTHGQYQSIYAENITRDRFSASMDFTPAERWTLSAVIYWVYSRTEGLITREKAWSWQGGLSVAYQATEALVLSAGYRHRQNRNITDNTRKNGNRVYLQAAYHFPRKKY